MDWLIGQAGVDEIERVADRLRGRTLHGRDDLRALSQRLAEVLRAAVREDGASWPAPDAADEDWGRRVKVTIHEVARRQLDRVLAALPAPPPVELGAVVACAEASVRENPELSGEMVGAVDEIQLVLAGHRETALIVRRAVDLLRRAVEAAQSVASEKRATGGAIVDLLRAEIDAKTEAQRAAIDALDPDDSPISDEGDDA